MVRNIYFSAIAMVIMMMASVNSYAQGRGDHMMNNRGGNREMAMNNNMNRGGNREMSMANMNRGGRDMMNCNMNRGGRPNVQVEMRGGDMRISGCMPHIDNRGFVPGWEGRVMYRDGRWGYLRGADWYWYDTYFEPDFYFGHPLDYFRPHFIPVDGRVAGVVAGAVAVGTLISLLAH